ncbi:MAG: O-antigen ligase family protein [Salibacteraceae bacterium]
MNGFFSYLATVEFVPQWVYLIPFVLILIRKAKRIKDYTIGFVKGKELISVNAIIIGLIIVFSVVNAIVNTPDRLHTVSAFPYHVLLLPTVVIAYFLNKNDLKILIGWIFFESIIAVIENVLGISTVFFWSPKFEVYNNPDLLYFSRPFGFSSNSSILAFKVLLGILLIHHQQLKGTYYKIVEGLFILVVIFTFGRTVILALLFFYAFKQLYFFQKSRKKKIEEWFFLFGLGTLMLLGILVLAVAFQDTIIGQFTRDTGSIELSGRDKIWAFYKSFISESPFLGNGSLKLMFGKYHAHNSFLQLISSNGWVISSLFIFLIIKNLRLTNVLYIATILMYSLAQYGVFWGISLVDILFYYFLLNGVKDLKFTNPFVNFNNKNINKA